DTMATMAPRIHAQEHRILPIAVAMAGQRLF
ncbi:MAG TPA: phosphoribosylglycinamide formyltransferase, partial [Synechococcus sp. UBA8638]|nr:phosphoribosylglycinamide formyltransferase [Synechococcus sp. UBA8638]